MLLALPLAMIVPSLVNVFITFRSFFILEISSSISWCFFCLGGCSYSSETFGMA